MGICRFCSAAPEALVGAVNCVTGWDMDMAEAIQVGRRAIALLRLFNYRHGLDISHESLSPVLVGSGRWSGAGPGHQRTSCCNAIHVLAVDGLGCRDGVSKTRDPGRARSGARVRRCRLMAAVEVELLPGFIRDSSDRGFSHARRTVTLQTGETLGQFLARLAAELPSGAAALG